MLEMVQRYVRLAQMADQQQRRQLPGRRRQRIQPPSGTRSKPTDGRHVCSWRASPSLFPHPTMGPSACPPRCASLSWAAHEPLRGQQCTMRARGRRRCRCGGRGRRRRGSTRPTCRWSGREVPPHAASTARAHLPPVNAAGRARRPTASAGTDRWVQKAKKQGREGKERGMGPPGKRPDARPRRNGAGQDGNNQVDVPREQTKSATGDCRTGAAM